MPERHVLEIRRTFEASPTRVFEAFRDPQLLAEWAAPGEHRTERVESDFEVGGRYRRTMRFPNGSRHVLSGEYLEIDPPHRLAYTYCWETIPGAPETRVAVELTAADGGTEVRLVHSGFEAEETAEDHRSGWQTCFDQLAELLES